MTTINLPQPDDAARAHSEALSQAIAHRIDQSGGLLSFMDYMHDALYLPKLGYYTGGSAKFGAAGDFVTAPEISPLFALSISSAIRPVLARCSEGVVLELGAGSGRLAAALLQACPEIFHYDILDISGELKARQKAHIEQTCPQYLSKIRWLDRLPQKPIEGVVLANEVLDAMPVMRFGFENQQLFEYHVGYQKIHDHIQFFFQKEKSGEHLDADIRPKIAALNLAKLANGYASEINILLNPWFKSLADCLKSGLILLFDYGFPAHEYYHPDRHQGTLMCHYRHHAHDDPFFYPGLQDITAHVDFTAVAEAAHEAGFDIAGYTTQASFLLECDILAHAEKLKKNANSEKFNYNLHQQVKTLTLPQEMGELFKAIALTRHYAHNIQGFQQQDLRYRL